MAHSLFDNRAGLDQLRIIPVNADVIGNGYLYSYLQTVAAGGLVHADNFSINDEVHADTVFVFDKNDELTDTAIQKVIKLVGTESPDVVAQYIVDAVNKTLLNVIAEFWGSGRVRFRNTVIDKRIILSESVVHGAFTVTSSPENQYVYCLGSDLNLPPVSNFVIGDKVNVNQHFSLSSGTKLVRIQARFRQPKDVKRRINFPASCAVSRYTRSGASDTTIITAPTDFFSSEHDMREIYLSGAGIVTGSYFIHKGGYKYDSGEYVADPKSAIVLGNGPLAAPGGPTTITTGYLKGAHWKVNVYFGFNIIFSYEPGLDGLKERDIQLPNLSINTSRFSTGTKIMKYELELVETVGT